MTAVLVLQQEHASVLELAALLLGVFILYATGLWLAGWISSSMMFEGFLLIVVAVLLTILGLQTGLI